MLLLLLACAADPVQDTAAVVPIGAQADAEAARPPLRWWYTCGDPVCRGWTRDRFLPVCDGVTDGDPCRRNGAECDLAMDGCNVNLKCAAEDPATVCPISRAAYKTDVRYLDAAGSEAVRDELMGFRLATWRYTADGAGGPDHLGFLIDDVEPSAAVAESGETVDLYGYTSMTVATVQAQQRQIEALEARLAALEAQLAAQK